jgi:hypothetical protein
MNTKVREGKLIYNEKLSEYIARKYVRIFVIIFCIFVLFYFNLITIIDGVYDSISERFFVGILGNSLLLLAVLSLLLLNKREILSTRFSIFENGIIPPTGNNKRRTGGKFLSFSNMLYVGVVQRQLNNKDYLHRIEIYLGDKTTFKREKIEADRETLEKFLAKCDKIEIKADDLSKRSIDEQLRIFVKKNLLEEASYMNYKKLYQ